MTSKSLTAITHDLIESYGKTAKNVITAYRAGNARAVGLMDKSWASAVDKASARLSEEVRGNAVTAQKKFTGLYSSAVTVTSEGADTAIGKVVEYAGKGVRQMAANASRFEKATGLTALNSLADAAIPAARIVVDLAAKMEAKSSTLASKVAGPAVNVKVKVAKVNRAAAKKVVRVRKAASS